MRGDEDMLKNETFKKFDSFLRKTLDGFNYLTWIEKGDVQKVLDKPEEYALGHISGNVDAWVDEETVIIEFNEIGVHFCFTPISKINKGLRFSEGQWC